MDASSCRNVEDRVQRSAFSLHSGSRRTSCSRSSKCYKFRPHPVPNDGRHAADAFIAPISAAILTRQKDKASDDGARAACASRGTSPAKARAQTCNTISLVTDTRHVLDRKKLPAKNIPDQKEGTNRAQKLVRREPMPTPSSALPGLTQVGSRSSAWKSLLTISNFQPQHSPRVAERPERLPTACGSSTFWKPYFTQNQPDATCLSPR